jgi:hypothetical protein
MNSCQIWGSDSGFSVDSGFFGAWHRVVSDISTNSTVFISKVKTTFKVYKCVHHHTIQINHHLHATVSPVYYLTFIYSSTCFGRLHTHHQELNNCSSSLVLPFERGDSSTVGRGRAGTTTTNSTATNTLQRYKPESATAVTELLMMGVKTPETCWAVNKRQVITWRNFCI